MNCPQTAWLSNEEYLKLLNRKAIQYRVPVYGSLNLTNNCNLRCAHCYLTGQTGMGETPVKELKTEQWTNLIDQITEAGCLFLLLTGGDPLIRRDFGRIYRHARENGLLVAVFTNGTLITNEIVELFRELPPRVVEISLYGATASTYESITGIEGSYERCMEGFSLLKGNNINLKLKTILMTLNRHEFFDIEKMAKENGVGFRFDAAIFPRFNGDRGPLSLRVAPEEIIRIESSNEEFLNKLTSFYEKFGNAPATDKMYMCGAGLTGFHIDSRGNLQPCIMTTRYRFNLLKGSFTDGWNGAITEMHRRKTGKSYPCNTCKKRLLCGFCPAFFDLENGAEDIPSEYLCRTGHLRFQSICDKLNLGVNNEKERREERFIAKL